jgi:hypothetical protein
LSKVAKANGIEVVRKHQGHHYGKFQKSILILVSNIFALASAYFVYGFLMQVGVDQDYV